MITIWPNMNILNICREEMKYSYSYIKCLPHNIRIIKYMCVTLIKWDFDYSIALKWEDRNSSSIYYSSILKVLYLANFDRHRLSTVWSKQLASNWIIKAFCDWAVNATKRETLESICSYPTTPLCKQVCKVRTTASHH